MLSFLFMLLLSGCVSNKKMLKDAREYMSNVNCLSRLERKFEDNHCTKLEIYRGHNQVVFRCHKISKYKKNMWDTWWFRLTSTGRKFTPEDLALVEAHTICIDPQYRIEAYPPEEEE